MSNCSLKILSCLKRQVPYFLIVPIVSQILVIMGNIGLQMEDYEGIFDEQTFHDFLQISAWVQILIFIIVIVIVKFKKCSK